MAKILVTITVYLFEMLTSYCFFSRIYNKKQKSTAIILLIGLTLFIPSSIIFNFINNEIINLSVCFLINTIFAFSCFKISIKNAAIQSIILDVLMFTTEIITIFILSSIINVPTNQYKNDLHLFLIIALICKLLYFILSQILALIIIKIGSNDNSLKRFIPLFIFPVITIASSTIFLFIALKSKVSTTYKITTTIICILYIFSCIFIFIYYQTLAANEAKINELESEQKLYNLNNTYMNILENQNDELQMLFHDTKHHYMALSSFESVEEVRQYIKKIHPVLENKNNLRISNNKTLDLILNNYISVCSQNDIKFTYETRTADLGYIDAAELIIILNNILDNAIEAAKNSNDKEIDLSLRHINNMDLLNVINSCDIPPKFNSKQLITTKANASSHGFGTRIIEKHTNKNHGNYDWFYDEIEHRFHLTIIFQPNQSSE